MEPKDTQQADSRRQEQSEATGSNGCRAESHTIGNEQEAGRTNGKQQVWSRKPPKRQLEVKATGSNMDVEQKT